MVRSLDELDEAVSVLLSSPKYLEAKKRAEALRKEALSSTSFSVDKQIDKTKDFFSHLKAQRPDVAQVLAPTESEILSILHERKTGSRSIIG